MKRSVLVAFCCAVILLHALPADSAYNSLRIVFFAGDTTHPIPAAFLERARAAGYTHVLVPVHVTNGQWSNGVYVGTSSATPGGREQLKDLFVQVHSYGMRLIPMLPSANQWGGEWVFAQNSLITYEPIVNDVLRGQAISGLTVDNLSPLDKLLRWALRLLGVSSQTEEIAVSLVQGDVVKAVPSWVSTPEGYARSFDSLIRDVVQAAFEASGLPAQELEFVHLGYDEPSIYSGQIAKDWKLLIGKSQEDLRWLYDNGPATGAFAHYGVGILARSGNIGAEAIAALYEGTTDAMGRRLGTDPSYFYTVPEADPGSPPDSAANQAVAAYAEGVRVLIADHLARRIAEMKAVLPRARPMMFADVFDPQGLGGYLNSSASLGTFAQQLRAMAPGLAGEVVLMPWWYHDTFTHQLEGGIDDAQITNVDKTLKAVLNPLWLACAAIPFPLTKLACYALNAKFIYEEIQAHPIGVDVTLHYDATGRRYDFSQTVAHFIDNGFHFAPMSAFEYGAVYEGAVVQALKLIDTTAALQPAEREYAVGFGSAAWEWRWDPALDAYAQPVPFNDMELLAAAALTKTGQLTSAFFGDLASIGGGWVWSDRRPVAKLDYLVVNRNVLWPDFDRVNAYKPNVSFYDALLYCNRLSEREQLDPVYTWDSLQFSDSFGDTSPIVSAVVGLTADLSSNGYRLPTVAELTAVNASADFLKGDGDITSEWVWNTASPGAPDRFVYANGSIESGMANGRAETTFRVVRSLDTTAPATTATLTPSPASGWARTAVTITLNATDASPGSGVKEIVVTMSGAQPLPQTHIGGGTASFVISAEGVTTVDYYAVDHAGNVETVLLATVRIDLTAPAVHCAAADLSWHPADVTIPCTADDGGSGLAAPADASFGLATSVPPGTETAAAATASRSVCDVAGNCVVAGPIGGNRIDRRAPVIGVEQPAGVEYPHSAVLTLQYAVTDQGSGVDSVAVRLDGNTTLAGHGLGSGQAIPLLTELALGPHVFRIDAADAVGNQSSTSVSFSVGADAGSLLAATSYFCRTGAIASRNECNGFEAKLRAAQAAISRGNLQAAGNQINAFLHQLRAQSGKAVSPRAFETLESDASWVLGHMH